MVKGYGQDKLELQAQWPLYQDELYDDVWPETEVPMLMLQGQLDPATPHDLALAARDRYDGPQQHFFSFPSSGHGVSLDSPLAADEETDCGMQLVLEFMADPQAEPDGSCVEVTAPIDFDPDADWAEYWFGTEDVWD